MILLNCNLRRRMKTPSAMVLSHSLSLGFESKSQDSNGLQASVRIPCSSLGSSNIRKSAKVVTMSLEGEGGHSALK